MNLQIHVALSVLLLASAAHADSWRIVASKTEPGILSLRDQSIAHTMATSEALLKKRDEAVLIRMALPPAQGHLPVFEVPAVQEARIDQACELLKRDPKAIPAENDDTILQAFGPSFAGMKKKAQVSFSNAGTWLSRIEYPVKDGKPRYSAFVISCSDPSGHRLEYAQNRGIASFAPLTLAKLTEISQRLKMGSGKHAASEATLFRSKARA